MAITGTPIRPGAAATARRSGRDGASPRQRYRADIDGLRAIAVIAVVVYHVAPDRLPGGFVGVDMFFVISGYLITRLIETETAAGRFSFAGFYERRIRRLLPALTAVFLVSGGAALVLLSPEQLEHFAGTLVSANLLGANIFLWRTSDYFAPAAELQPLLHTWSLSVEEQFYLLFPAAFVVLHRLGRRAVVAALALAAALSLALALWGGAHKPVATFYLLPTRAWELLLGALLALAPLPAARSGSRSMAAGLAVVAALAIAAAAALPPPPGRPEAAIALACIGTALLIHAGGISPAVARHLSPRPLVVLGLASYSLYLWHWPLLVFTRHVTAIRDLGPVAAVAVIGVSLAVALVSWRLIECPFRRGWAR